MNYSMTNVLEAFKDEKRTYYHKNKIEPKEKIIQIGFIYGIVEIKVKR